MTETFTLALVGSPFGLKGFVKVRSLSEETAHITALKQVKLRQGDTEKVYSIEEIMLTGPGQSGDARGKSLILAKFAGIDSPEAARALKGAELVADRSEAAPLKEAEYYIEDLKGLSVISADPETEEILGHITDILEGGGGQLAELKLLSGELKLVPFRNEFFGNVDFKKSRIILREKWILE